MAFLLADENLPMPAVEMLRELGHDVQTLLDLDQAGLAVPDDMVLSLASSHNRMLLTLNRKDFIKLHSLQPDHAGIIVCKADASFIGLATRVDSCLQANTDTHGQLLRVQRPAS
jgi:predicted nuclease of predicted toxin-antitoxin system